MIYILKFIAAFLLPPGLFVLLGVILSTYLWRKRQHFGCLAFSLSAFLTLLLYFSSTLLGAKLLGQPLENRYSQQQPYAAQVIVVLGGGSVGSVPDGAERGGLMSAGAARLLTAARLAKQHSLPVLISGGQVFSDGVSEALGRRAYSAAAGAAAGADYRRNAGQNNEGKCCLYCCALP